MTPPPTAKSTDLRSMPARASCWWIFPAIDRLFWSSPAGSGEVTLLLRERGAARIDGIDPYTAEAYRRRTGQEAQPLTFANIAAGALAGRRYSLIVCSFALHLCEQSRLPRLMMELRTISDALLILTPHKRPEIREEWGWELFGELIIRLSNERPHILNKSF